MNAVQGERVRVVDREKDCLDGTLESALKPYRAYLERFADVARPVFSNKIPEIWARAFPMIDPPTEPNGLGVILLNSNADTHFSFTNALGMVSAEQMRGIHIARPNIQMPAGLLRCTTTWSNIHGRPRRFPNASVRHLSTEIGSFVVCNPSPAARS